MCLQHGCGEKPPRSCHASAARCRPCTAQLPIMQPASNCSVPVPLRSLPLQGYFSELETAATQLFVFLFDFSNISIKAGGRKLRGRELGAASFVPCLLDFLTSRYAAARVHSGRWMRQVGCCAEAHLRCMHACCMQFVALSAPGVHAKSLPAAVASRKKSVYPPAARLPAPLTRSSPAPMLRLARSAASSLNELTVSCTASCNLLTSHADGKAAMALLSSFLPTCGDPSAQVRFFHTLKQDSAWIGRRREQEAGDLEGWLTAAHCHHKLAAVHHGCAASRIVAFLPSRSCAATCAPSWACCSTCTPGWGSSVGAGALTCCWAVLHSFKQVASGRLQPRPVPNCASQGGMNCSRSTNEHRFQCSFCMGAGVLHFMGQPT